MYMGPTTFPSAPPRSSKTRDRSLADLLQPAPRHGGLAMEGYWVWCGSVIRGEDGRYHMFASRWPRELAFFDGYRCYSEIVRAVADTPVGPFEFQEVVLPARGEQYWDGQMTHNPAITRTDGKYVLFYMGTTYRGPRPSREMLEVKHCRQAMESNGNYCIGYATSDSLEGPWKRVDEPVLTPRPGKWDQNVVTNPAPCVREDGSILLYYRSNTPNGLRLGVAGATHLGAPFERLRDEPCIQFPAGHVEDPFVWWNGERFELVAKDMTGEITGERGAGMRAVSDDGLHFELAEPVKAYSRRIRWDDGTSTEFTHVERPSLLIENGKPVCLYVAAGLGEWPFQFDKSTRNVAVPIERC